MQLKVTIIKVICYKYGRRRINDELMALVMNLALSNPKMKNASEGERQHVVQDITHKFKEGFGKGEQAISDFVQGV